MARARLACGMVVKGARRSGGETLLEGAAREEGDGFAFLGWLAEPRETSLKLGIPGLR